MTTEAWVAMAGLGAVVLLNLAALVWGASTISSSVTHLDGVVNQLTRTLKSLERALHALDLRVVRLEERHRMGDPPSH